MVVAGVPLIETPAEVELTVEVSAAPLELVSEPPPQPAAANTIPAIAQYRRRSAFPISYSCSWSNFYEARMLGRLQLSDNVSVIPYTAVQHFCISAEIDSAVTVPLEKT